MKRIPILLLICAICACTNTGELHIVTTGDTHGAWFADSYTQNSNLKPSLMSVKYYLDSLRAEVGKNNVLLLDAGDCLQGDNATYYYNYIDTSGIHPFVKIAKTLDYDVMAVGNHDIETGHKVYDKIYKQLKGVGIDWLAANAINTKDGNAYFPTYKIVRKAGRKIAVIGFTNANIKAWVPAEQYSGMDFVSLVSIMQENVDAVRNKENPDFLIVLTHTGTGNGDGKQLESQGLDLLQTLNGVDLLVCAHDHMALALESNGVCLLNSGQGACTIGHAILDNQGLRAEIVGLNENKTDEKMRSDFKAEFEKVKEYSMRPIGKLSVELRTREAYSAPSPYVNLVHKVQLLATAADISFAAPLAYDAVIKPGEVTFNDMLTIYPYENQLVAARMTGEEIRRYLEYSYNDWIQSGKPQVLKITQRDDSSEWFFEGRTYNFDSAAGINYSVDVSKEYGSRINIISLADGSIFNPKAWYNVAINSYRASGAGGHLASGAGISSEQMEERIIAKYPSIRDLVFDYFLANEDVNEALVGESLGEWHWLPRGTSERISKDLELLF